MNQAKVKRESGAMAFASSGASVRGKKQPIEDSERSCTKKKGNRPIRQSAFTTHLRSQDEVVSSCDAGRTEQGQAMTRHIAAQALPINEPTSQTRNCTRTVSLSASGHPALLHGAPSRVPITGASFAMHNLLLSPTAQPVSASVIAMEVGGSVRVTIDSRTRSMRSELIDKVARKALERLERVLHNHGWSTQRGRGTPTTDTEDLT